MDSSFAELNLPDSRTSETVRQWETSARSLVDTPEELTVRIPGVRSEDPWSEASLRGAEEQFLEAYGDRTQEIPISAQEDYQKFLGEGLIRRFGGRWVLLGEELIDVAGAGSAFGVAYDCAPYIDPVPSLLEMAIQHADASWWVGTFRTVKKALPDKSDS